MSRQSLRKVKLTSKFEEFSSSRLSIQRSNQQQTQDTTSANGTPIKVETQTPTATAAAADDAVQLPETPAPVKERASHKILRQKATSITPATPAYETSTPTPYSHVTPAPKLTANGKIRGRPRKCWQKAETVVKPISSTREELLRLREENANLKVQLEQRTLEFEDLKRQSSYTGQTVPKIDYDDLKEKYNQDIAYTKRHQWCLVCLNPAKYHCCWNTTYCSQKCQVTDWYNRHSKSCERRKNLKTVS